MAVGKSFTGEELDVLFADKRASKDSRRRGKGTELHNAFIRHYLGLWLSKLFTIYCQPFKIIQPLTNNLRVTFVSPRPGGACLY